MIIPYWKEKKVEGCFINMSSISEPRPRPFLVWYAASKLVSSRKEAKLTRGRQRCCDSGKLSPAT